MNEVLINGKTIVIPNEILFCIADENYTRIYFTGNRTKIVPITLKNIEMILQHYSFFRIHKSYLVNLQHILDNTERFEVEMVNNRSLTISRRKVAKFRRI